jgi:hypothetical protein
MDNMIDFLVNESDYFTAPASTKYHLAHEGGLAEHSLLVYDALVKLNNAFGTEIHEHKMITTALLHDLAKTGFYVSQQKWRKDDHDRWESYTAWTVEDTHPLGHGTKSLYLIEKYLDLDTDEAAAVVFHMGCWTAGITSDYPLGRSFNAAADRYPLVVLLGTADWLSSRLVEERT